MVWNRSHVAVKELVNNKKNLRDYSDEELFKFLDENETTPANVLSCICSEILRRQKEWMKKA